MTGSGLGRPKTTATEHADNPHEHNDQPHYEPPGLVCEFDNGGVVSLDVVGIGVML